MKKTINIFILVLLTITFAMPFAIKAQKHYGFTGERGNGNVVKRERAVSGFHAIDVSGGIDVYIIQDKMEKAVVEADENLHGLIITEVENGVLKIYHNKSIRNSKAMKVHVYVTKLDKIEASGASDVYSESKLILPTLTADMGGGSDIDLNCDISDLKCNLNGGSDAKLKGKVENAELTAVGGSDIKASGLKIKKCTIEVTGGSDAWVNVTDELSVTANGGSDVTYTGAARIVSKHLSGASDLIKK